jgi:hypothetical protein
VIQDPIALNRTRWSIAVGLACLAGLGLWVVLSPKQERAAKTVPASVVEQRHEASAPAVPPPAPSARLPAAALSAPPPPNTLNVVGPGPNDPHEPGMVPHPLDEARARIDTENRLTQALNDAIAFRKVKEMREMLVTYRKLDPKDVDKSQLGYEVIADCIEFPGEASLAAARNFYDIQRHSPLRRFVRRICFENTN